MLFVAYIILGILAGLLSGFMGLGGGVIIIPVLVYVFHFSQHSAQGTTLAMMVPPITLAAAYSYFKEGHIQINTALLLAIGFIIGGFISGELVQKINDAALKKTFGVILLIVAVKMIWSK